MHLMGVVNFGAAKQTIPLLSLQLANNIIVIYPPLTISGLGTGIA
jgi:hypothetical protein